MTMNPETWRRAAEVLDQACGGMVCPRYAPRPAGEP